MTSFSGLGMGLGALPRLSNAKTRSISAENLTGAKGQGGRATEGTGKGASAGLGVGWKVSPSIEIKPGETRTIADITGSGAIQHIWLTPAGIKLREFVIRMYWDGQEHPSVEAPLGDFFCCGWGGQNFLVSSLAICVNTNRGFNSYWEMPFRKSARITIENVSPDQSAILYYQITYTETEVPADLAYFHAHFRRSNPLPFGQNYTILEGVKGHGHYVGTYMAWGVNNSGWWGEGEIKFFMDGDVEFPTICGTGTEDYFCGAYCFDRGFFEGGEHAYEGFTTAYAGLPQIIRPDGMYKSQTRFGLYRWHIMDPIRFESDLRVTVQALGWRTNEKNGRYLPLQDDIASVAYWYQSLPGAKFPPMLSRDELEVI